MEGLLSTGPTPSSFKVTSNYVNGFGYYEALIHQPLKKHYPQVVLKYLYVTPKYLQVTPKYVEFTPKYFQVTALYTSDE